MMEVFPERGLCCFQPWLSLFCQRRRRQTFAVSFPSLSNLARCSFPPKGFPVSLPPLFPVLSLSPSLSACSLCENGCLPYRETTQRHAGTGWWQTLAVVLFIEAENYTVTFPAFLLEIRSRSGLSIQDRDPGGGERGVLLQLLPPPSFPSGWLTSLFTPVFW